MARSRSAFCPGAGLALLGYPRPGVAGLALFCMVISCFFLVALLPGPGSLRATLLALALSVLFSSVESVFVAKIAIPAETDNPLARFFIPICLVGYLGIGIAFMLMHTNISALRIPDDGMAPTLRRDDLTLYHPGVNDAQLTYGRLVVFLKTQESVRKREAKVSVGRIMAKPGDQVSIRDGNYLINGFPGPPVPPAGNQQPALMVPAPPESLIVPAGQYFIVQDNPSVGRDSRHFAWIGRPQILSDRLLALGLADFGKRVE